MKASTTISNLKHHEGKEVTLAGWVYKNRPSGKLVFLVLRDGTGLCQCVIEKNDASADYFDNAKRLSQEASVVVRGTVNADERSVGGYELRVTGMDIVHDSTDYPITPKPHGVEFLFKHRHLWFRSQRQFLIMRLRHTLIDAIRSFFNNNGFTCVDTPTRGAYDLANFTPVGQFELPEYEMQKISFPPVLEIIEYIERNAKPGKTKDRVRG